MSEPSMNELHDKVIWDTRFDVIRNVIAALASDLDVPNTTIAGITARAYGWEVTDPCDLERAARELGITLP